IPRRSEATGPHWGPVPAPPCGNWPGSHSSACAAKWLVFVEGFFVFSDPRGCFPDDLLRGQVTQEGHSPTKISSSPSDASDTFLFSALRKASAPSLSAPGSEVPRGEHR